MRSWKSPYFYLTILFAIFIAAGMLHYTGVSASTFKFSQFWGSEVLIDRISRICNRRNATEELLDIAFVKSGKAAKTQSHFEEWHAYKTIVYNFPPENQSEQKMVRIFAYVNDQNRVVDCSVTVNWQTTKSPNLNRLNK